MKTRKLILGSSVIALALVAAATSARADVTNTYGGTGCRANFKSIDANMTRVVTKNANNVITSDRITNNTGSPVRVACPIPKTTSGPGISNDAVLSVSVPVTTNGDFVSCGVQIWNAYQVSNAGNDTSAFVESYFGGTSSSMTVTLNPWDPTSYWNGAGIPGNWYYVELICDLPNGAGIDRYTVVEAGTAQASRILGMESCIASNRTPLKNWEYRSDYPAGGFMYSNGGGVEDGALQFDCPIPAGQRAEFSLGPALNPINVNGCNVDNEDLSQMVWPSTSPTYPSQFLPKTGQPRIIAPPLGTHKLVCGMRDPGTGDGRLIAMRTTPLAPLSRSGWEVKDAKGAVETAPIDGNNGTRWTTNAPQVADGSQFVVVNMAASKTIKQIVLDSAGSAGDYPRGYQVFVSATNGNWGTAVASGTATGPLVEIAFSAAKTGQYIKIVQTGTSSKWWSIYELNVYN